MLQDSSKYFSEEVQTLMEQEQGHGWHDYVDAFASASWDYYVVLAVMIAIGAALPYVVRWAVREQVERTKQLHEKVDKILQRLPERGDQGNCDSESGPHGPKGPPDDNR